MSYLCRNVLPQHIRDEKHGITSQKIVNMYNKPHPRTGYEGPDGE